jgi:uncharacterized LabA/DUF88 family protein
MNEEKRFAVLIDADNVSAKYIKYIFDEISNYGIATYKRIYGDWTTPNTASWKDVLLENSITPVQQYGYTVGKNATDSAMIIDAMDILYSGNVDGYCIVSSDSDFTKLSARLRESGMLVVGMGEKKTPKPFIAACNQFKYLDVIAASDQEGIAGQGANESADRGQFAQKKMESRGGQTKKDDASSKNGKSPIIQDSGEVVKNMTDISVIKAAILKMMNEADESAQGMHMGEIGNRLVNRYPDFDVRNYGDNKLSKFLKKIDFLEIQTKGKDGTAMWVTLKSDNEAKPTPKSSGNQRKRRRINKRK